MSSVENLYKLCEKYKIPFLENYGKKTLYYDGEQVEVSERTTIRPGRKQMDIFI